MKQALFILAVALYLVSLCACGDQKIHSKSKQGNATQQVVQEQMANATGETTAPPTAIPEQQPASDETTPETSVPEPEPMQPAEALPDYKPAQASGELDVDLTTLSSLRVPENSISDCPAGSPICCDVLMVLCMRVADRLHPIFQTDTADIRSPRLPFFHRGRSAGPHC